MQPDQTIEKRDIFCKSKSGSRWEFYFSHKMMTFLTLPQQPIKFRSRKILWTFLSVFIRLIWGDQQHAFWFLWTCVDDMLYKDGWSHPSLPWELINFQTSWSQFSEPLVNRGSCAGCARHAFDSWLNHRHVKSCYCYPREGVMHTRTMKPQTVHLARSAEPRALMWIHRFDKIT